MEEDIKNSYENDIKLLILSECLILVGDGGHNIREILFGLTIAIIMLYAFITEMKHSLIRIYKKTNFTEIIKIIEKTGKYPHKDNDFFEDIYHSINTFNKSYYKSHTYTPDDIREHSENDRKEMLLTMIKFCEKNELFIEQFYDYTKDINVVGINEEEMKIYNPNIDTISSDEKEYKEYVRDKRQLCIASLFNPTGSRNITLDRLQELFAIDNKRYTFDINDSFINVANRKISELVGQDINIQVDEELSKARYFTELKIDAKEIPYAFKRSTKKIKSVFPKKRSKSRTRISSKNSKKNRKESRKTRKISKKNSKKRKESRKTRKRSIKKPTY